MTGPVLYRETQRFRQWWVWVLLLVVAAAAWWAFIQQIILGRPFGQNPAPDWGVWLLWVVIGIGLPALLLSIRMAVEVMSDQVVIRYRPLVKRSIPAAEIVEAKARTYQPVKEYGGWGIKGWSRKNMAYNMSGHRGVELTLRDGRRVMLGSQQPEQLAQAILTQARPPR